MYTQGGSFDLFRPKSVEDGKIPTKKVKVDLFNRNKWSFNWFHPTGTSKKNTLYCKHLDNVAWSWSCTRRRTSTSRPSWSSKRPSWGSTRRRRVEPQLGRDGLDRDELVLLQVQLQHNVDEMGDKYSKAIISEKSMELQWKNQQKNL